MPLLQSFSYVPLDAGVATSSPEAEEVSVSTISATAVATGHLMFKIENYSRLKARHGGYGSFIDSSEFKVGGHTWKIRCYLNGNSKANAGFVSLFLHLCSDPIVGRAFVQAEYEFALVRHQDTPLEYGHQGKPSTASHGMRSVVSAFYHGVGGLSQFISVEELERSKFLKDDCFAIRCTVTVVEERTVKEKAVQPGDMERMGMLCKCDDELCKRRHARPADETFLERFANFCYSICRGGPVRITQ